MRPDYYNILGIGRNADMAAVKRAYRVRAKQCHPDLNPAPGATQQFIQVNEAYEILSDAQKRRAYDHSLLAPASNVPPGRTQIKEEQYRQWVAQAQKRSQEYARMDYQEFKRSRFEHAEATAFLYLQFLLIAVVWLLATFILIGPFAAFYFVDWKGVLLAPILVPAAMKVYGKGWEGWLELKSYL